MRRRRALFHQAGTGEDQPGRRRENFALVIGWEDSWRCPRIFVENMGRSWEKWKWTKDSGNPALCMIRKDDLLLDWNFPRIFSGRMMGRVLCKVSFFQFWSVDGFHGQLLEPLGSTRIIKNTRKCWA